MTREIKTLRCLFPEPKPPRRRNFIKENVKSLRKMEQMFHTNSKGAKDVKLPIIRNKSSAKPNGAHVTIRNESTPDESIENGIANLIIHTSANKNKSDRKTSAPVFSNRRQIFKKQIRPSVHECNLRKSLTQKEQMHKKSDNQKLRANSNADISQKNSSSIGAFESNIKSKNQGVQTLDVQDIESLYSEGIIRYPSGKIRDPEKSCSPEASDVPPNSNCNETQTKNDSGHVHNDNIDHIKLNKDRVCLASKLASQLNNSAPPPSYRVGVVPKYIKERKEELEREKIAKATAKQSDCPKGHVLLPDSERIETLNMLKKNHDECVNELIMLPIRTDTLRSQRRKMEIEKNLEKLEEAIKLFSRPKVYVKVDS